MSLTHELLLLLLVAAASMAAVDGRRQVSFMACSQTSNYYDVADKVMYTCKMAIDGNKQRHIHAKSGCAVTGYGNGQAWNGYFAQPVSLTNIRVLSRVTTSFMRHSTNFAVEVYNGKEWHRCNTVTGFYTTKLISCRVNNAMIVRLRRLSKEHLALCEVEAFVSSSSVAPETPKQLTFDSCFQTSDYQYLPTKRYLTCNHAMDGALEQNYAGKFGCSHTNSALGSAWYGYFAHPVQLTNVGILSRNDDRHMPQSTDIAVEVNDGKKWRRCATIKGVYVYKLVDCKVNNVMAVRIMRLSNNYLTLCEVEVYGEPGLASGSTSESQVSFLTCYQTSTAYDVREDILHICKMAIDGNKQRHLHAKPSCAATNSGNGEAWNGYFAQPVSLTNIRVLSREREHHMSQSTNFAVEVYNGKKWHRCNTVTGFYTTKLISCRVNNAMIVKLTRLSTDHLTLCEVEAFVSSSSVTPETPKQLTFHSCSQSSTAADRTCNLAMDGALGQSPNGKFGCASTNFASESAWVGHFAHPAQLTNVGILSRNDNPHMALSTDISVDVNDGKKWHRCATVKGVYLYKIVDCRVNNVTAVRIKRLSKNHFTLCEVEAYG